MCIKLQNEFRTKEMLLSLYFPMKADIKERTLSSHVHETFEQYSVCESEVGTTQDHQVNKAGIY